MSTGVASVSVVPDASRVTSNGASPVDGDGTSDATGALSGGGAAFTVIGTDAVEVFPAVSRTVTTAVHVPACV